MAEEGEKILQINIEDEMKTAYIDYSMSVIVSRALPDVRDGLKPVHRRILYGMLDLGMLSNRPYKKSARIVGEVLGKYHPHGDTAVYDAMVRMAQPWSLRYPLIDGQGNFGSLDGDSPAAMRYTEARLKKIAEEILRDLDKDTVDFQLNFDDSLQEPKVLPTRVPNLLINGASGIAVGMATNMAPHNLTEIINATVAFIENRQITIVELMKMVTAPDFPTGAIIYGYEGVREAFETGKGRIVMRAKTTIETTASGKELIIVTEVPYQVNPEIMIQKTADLINEKKIEGLSNVNDESGRDGMRIVYTLKKDAIANVVLNNLYKHTALQSTFNVNNIALVNGRPVLLNLKDLIHHFVEHRHEVVTRRTQFELNEAEKRAHILAGLIIALDNIDAVIELIRASRTPEDAKNGLMEKFALTEVQAKAILDLRLQKLTSLESDKLREEREEVLRLVADLKDILASEPRRMNIIREELVEIKEKYGDERKTVVEYTGDDFRMEDMIADEHVAITISHLGYIKRTPIIEFREQNRGGKGSKGSATRDEDFVERLFIASNHNYMLFFTEKGKCFWLKVYEIPEGNKVSKGRAIQNLINLEPGDKVKAVLNVKDITKEEYINNNFIILCTRKGVIKKTSLEAYSRPRQNGINAINVREGDQLIEAKLTNGKNEILMAVRSGKAIRFPEFKVRPMGRNATGVRGVMLANENDEVIGMVCVENLETGILIVTEKGYGKRTKLQDYRITNRGGKGVKTVSITDKTGNLVAIKEVSDEDHLMIINKSGIVIRLSVAHLRLMGRATQGVRLIKIMEGDAIAAVEKIDASRFGDEEVEETKDALVSEEEIQAELATQPEMVEEDAEEEDDIAEEGEEDANNKNE
jgi:DNA gyrase subunit A